MSHLGLSTQYPMFSCFNPSIAYIWMLVIENTPKITLPKAISLFNSVTLDCLIVELLGRSQVEVVLCLFVCCFVMFYMFPTVGCFSLLPSLLGCSVFSHSY